MRSFQYRATDRSGRLVRGVLEAPDESGALGKIREMGLRVLRLSGRGDELAEHQRWARGYFSFIFHRIKSKDLAVWYRQFTYMLRAGMNIYEAAESIGRKTRNRTLRRVAAEIAEAARRGEPPLPVMYRWPCAFPPFVRSLVSVGHDTGMLEETFKRIADFYDRAYNLEMLWRIETFYAKILLLGILLIPNIPALILGGFSAYVHAVLPWILRLGLSLVGLLLGWRALRLLPGFAEAVDHLKLVLPWFGSIVRRSAVSRWARALAMMMEAGVPVTRAVRESAGAAGNVALEQSIARRAEMLDAGQPLSVVMHDAGRIPEQVVDMVATGERSGNIAGMLDAAAEYYELETDSAQKQTAITVAIVIWAVLAIMVGIIVISFYSGYAQKINDIMNE